MPLLFSYKKTFAVCSAVFLFVQTKESIAENFRVNK